MRRSSLIISETTNGVGCNSLTATRTVVRVFLLLALLACFGLFIYQIVGEILKQNTHPVISNSGIVLEHPLFPDVTVCSQFPLSNVTLLQFFSEYLNTLSDLDALVASTTSSSITMNHRPILSELLGNLFLYAVNVLDLSVPDENILFNVPIFNPIDTGYYQYGNLVNCTSNPQLVAMGGMGTASHTLQWCNTWSCFDSNDFLANAIFTNNYFQMNLNDLQPSSLSSIGFDLEVMIHPRGTIPNSNQAIYIEPGTVVTINVQQMNISRLEAPWGNCTTQKVLEPGVEGSPTYDTNACTDICIQNQLFEACGCLSHTLMFTENQVRLAGGQTFCLNISDSLNDFRKDGNSMNIALLNGITKKPLCLTNFLPDISICDCRPPCFEIQYSTTLSTVSMDPLYQYNFITEPPISAAIYDEIFNVYADILNNTRNQNMSVKDTLNKLRNIPTITDNFVDLTVTFVDDSTYRVTDTPDLFSNLVSFSKIGLVVLIVTAVALLIELLCFVTTVCSKRRNEIKMESSFEMGHGQNVHNSCSSQVTLKNGAKVNDPTAGRPNEMLLQIVKQQHLEISEMKESLDQQMNEITELRQQMSEMKELQQRLQQMDEMKVSLDENRSIG